MATSDSYQKPTLPTLNARTSSSLSLQISRTSQVSSSSSSQATASQDANLVQAGPSGALSRPSCNAGDENAYIRGEAAKRVHPLNANHIVPWETMSACHADLADWLEDKWHKFKRGKPYLPTPPGILFLGGQGTGKSALSQSFAFHIGAVLFIVDATIKGSLMGQSERILEAIFNKAREHARIGIPVVLVFEEVDHFMPGDHVHKSTSEPSSSIVGLFKKQAGLLEDEGLPAFLFGITNHPPKLEIKDIGRRFGTKVHMKMPGPDELKQFWMSAFRKYRHSLDDSQWTVLANNKESEGHVIAEIRAVASKAYEDHLSEERKARKWVKEQDEVGTFFRPAASDERAHIEIPEQKLYDQGHEVRRRCIDLGTIMEILKTGNKGRPWPRHNKAGLDMALEAWLNEVEGVDSI